MIDGTTKQPPFTAGMVEGLTDLIQKKLGDPPYIWSTVRRVFFDVTTYQNTTPKGNLRQPPGLFHKIVLKLESRGCEINYPEQHDGS